jgi:hypothetical protein
VIDDRAPVIADHPSLTAEQNLLTIDHPPAHR